MRARLTSPKVTRALLFCGVILFLIGVWKGLRAGGSDYRVFYSAAQLALEGRSDVLYREGPDRFLYAPGFAYALIPFALLPYTLSHGLWLALCAGGFFLSMRALSRRIDGIGSWGKVAVSIAVIFFMRSVWIDLRYGQVNLLILAASVGALLSISAREDEPLGSRWGKFLSWFFFSLAAFAKIYPLPLFLIPLLTLFRKETRKGWQAILLGSFAGLGVLVLLPVLFSHQSSQFLYGEWLQALLGRGFPLETHNQSLLAFLHRIFSGEIIRSHQTGGEPMLLLGRVFSDSTIRAVFGAATVGIGILFVRSAARFARRGDALHLGLCIALCFLPAHLIWKPYFLLGIPLAAAVFATISEERDAGRRARGYLIFAGLFLIAHLSSAEIIGRHASAWYEAFSGFLWVHLGLIALSLLFS